MINIEIKCLECGKTVLRYAGEVNRSISLGRKFFCSQFCAATFGNRSRKAKEIKISCPTCKKDFVTSTKKKAAKFCSRSCASSGSMTEFRRDAQRRAGFAKKSNLISIAESLKLREGWKYLALRDKLQKSGRQFEFEFNLRGYVFDLALFDAKILVEFDGPNHLNEFQKEIDEKKRKAGESSGFSVVHRTVLPAIVISPDSIDGL